jgi:hypothetical protein
MNSSERERLRIAILQQLAQVGESGMQLPHILTGAKLAGFPEATSSELASELAYLCDKDLICPIAKAISPENRRWRIVASGRDHLAELGLG